MLSYSYICLLFIFINAIKFIILTLFHFIDATFPSQYSSTKLQAAAR